MDGVLDEVRSQARATRPARRPVTQPTSQATTRPAAPARKKLFVAGHSRGGAFAVLAAAAFARAGDLPELGGVYTFGQPRVGNGPFVQSLPSLDVSLFRFVNRDDPIPGVPPAGLIPPNLGVAERLNEHVGYQHGGISVRLLADGRIVRGGTNDPEGSTLTDPRAAAAGINQHYQPGYYAAIYQALANPQLASEPAWRAGVTPERVASLPRPVQ
jgi:hypothetical protein